MFKIYGFAVSALTALALLNGCSSNPPRQDRSVASVQVGTDFRCLGDDGIVGDLRVASDGQAVDYTDPNRGCGFSGPQDAGADHPNATKFMGFCHFNAKKITGTSGVILDNSIFATRPGAIMIGLEILQCQPPAPHRQ